MEAIRTVHKHPTPNYTVDNINKYNLLINNNNEADLSVCHIQAHTFDTNEYWSP